MKESAVTKEQVGRRTGPIEHANPYSSVEFSINGLEIAYQFKIWNTASTPMCVLVKEDSNIVPRLKVGDTLNMKYYPTGSAYSPECLETAILHITKNDQGRFRGHYLVGLEILEGRGQQKLN